MYYGGKIRFSITAKGLQEAGEHATTQNQICKDDALYELKVLEEDMAESVHSTGYGSEHDEW